MFALELPIAQMTVSLPLLLLVGFGVGFFSGMFGLGGGFLATPLLIFMGVSPAVAVASSANYIVGVSIFASSLHWRREQMDVHIGSIIILGGIIGAAIGVGLFALWRQEGTIDEVIAFGFIALLTFIGVMMAWESVGVIRRKARKIRPSRLLPLHWLHPLPFKVRFRASRIYISFLLPLVMGLIAGIFSALLGIGGGLLLIPAMIYLLRMPMGIVVGTSLLYTSAIAIIVTLFHALATQTVDVILALALMLGGILAVPLGTRVARVLPNEYLRAIMALLLLLVAGQMVADVMSHDAFSQAGGLASSSWQGRFRDFAQGHPLLYGAAAVLLMGGVAALASRIKTPYNTKRR